MLGTKTEAVLNDTGERKKAIKQMEILENILGGKGSAGDDVWHEDSGKRSGALVEVTE